MGLLTFAGRNQAASRERLGQQEIDGIAEGAILIFGECEDEIAEFRVEHHAGTDFWSFNTIVCHGSHLAAILAQE